MLNLPYDGRDAGILLFVASMNAGAPMTFVPDGRILDHCCAECDFLQHVARWWPDMQLEGVDQARQERPNVIQADVLDPELYAPDSFDQIVSLSAIEHIGLGHYGDPKDPDGDTKAIENCVRWLKPGGWLYLDVPYDPTGYRIMTTECRVYDDAAIAARFPIEPVWFGYAAANTPGILVDKPTEPHKRFYYVSMVWQKPNG